VTESPNKLLNLLEHHRLFLNEILHAIEDRDITAEQVKLSLGKIEKDLEKAKRFLRTPD